MTRWNRSLSVVGGRAIIAGLGGLYVALAIAHPFVPGAETASLTLHLVIVLLAGGPGLLLLSGVYWLPRTDIHQDLYPAVARWCVGGIGIMLGLLAITSLAADLTNVVANVLILTGLGGTAGFIAGTYRARAMTRKRDLQETVEQLRTSNERLEQFAYAASHDLQEPLRMVSSYLQLIENRYDDDLDEDGREFLGFAVDGADRMRVMVESLLHYSRITDRTEPLEPVDIEGVLDGVRDNLRMVIDETDATITTDELPTVLGDPEQLTLVFQNLLSNALKYSGEAPSRVHVAAERGGEGWQFSVADEGIGIDPRYHDQIFEVFNQLERDQTETGSVGIGLALCERIVERHGGRMWVESEPGEGATFYFTVAGVRTERPEESTRSVAPA